MAQKKSLSENVYEDLKARILYNHLKPGDMISEIELSEQYHVSRTPIRQAMQKLSDRGLVQIKDGVGTYVTFITQQDVIHAYEARNAVERIAAKTAMYRIAAHELDELERQFLLLRTQLSTGGYGASLDKVVGADWALHDLIVERSNNPLLGQMLEQINLIMRRYQYGHVSTFERAQEEHLTIVRMLREKDTDGLDKALDQHIRFQSI